MDREAHVRRAAQERAVALANAFVEAQPLPDEYALEFEAIRPVGQGYYVQYTKVFKEPTKESPPYRLVIVEPDGHAHWGNP
jgi:hypothetical protein